MAICGDFGGIAIKGGRERPCETPVRNGLCVFHGGLGPESLTDEVRERIVGAVRAGVYLAVAAESNGVSRYNARDWMRKGEQDSSGPCYEFYEAIVAARAYAESQAVAVIRKAATGWAYRRTRKKLNAAGEVLEEEVHEGSDWDWKAAAWYLERAFPERWREQSQVIGGGPNGEQLQRIEIELINPSVDHHAVIPVIEGVPVLPSPTEDWPEGVLPEPEE